VDPQEITKVTARLRRGCHSLALPACDKLSPVHGTDNLTSCLVYISL